MSEPRARKNHNPAQDTPTESGACTPRIETWTLSASASSHYPTPPNYESTRRGQLLSRNTRRRLRVHVGY